MTHLKIRGLKIYQPFLHSFDICFTKRLVETFRRLPFTVLLWSQHTELSNSFEPKKHENWPFLSYFFLSSFEFNKSQHWFHKLSCYKEETFKVRQSTILATSINFCQVSRRQSLIIEPLLNFWIYRLLSISWQNYHWKKTKKNIVWDNAPAIVYRAVLGLENFQFLFNKTIFHFGICG